jgi:hypothetical protein
MILRLAASLFKAPSPQQSRLLRALLLQLLGHDRDPRPPVLRIEPEAAETDEHGVFHGWVERQGELGEDVRKLLELGGLQEASLPFTQPGHEPGAWRRAPALDVTIEPRTASDWPSLQLTLQDALDLAKEPLQLHYEDGRNDPAFINWLAEPRLRGDLAALESAPARVVIHGGGTGGIKRWLDELVDRETLSREQQRRLWRTWVLFDKDAGKLDACAPSKSTEDLMHLCEQVVDKHRIPFTWICLQRREIESYVPDDGLRQTGAAGSEEAAKLLRQWRSHPDRQHLAWAYDMKGGLKGDLVGGVLDERRVELRSPDTAPLAEELKEPFRSLDEETRHVLRNGLGGNVLNKPLHASPTPSWLHQIANEYDRGPSHQLPRAALLQSIFDRI